MGKVLADFSLRGTLASRPTDNSAGTTGRLYSTTDTAQYFRDNGTTWDEIFTSSGNKQLFLQAAGVSSGVASPVTVFPGGGAAGFGSIDLPANWWTDSRVLEEVFIGNLIGDVTPPTFTFAFGFLGAAYLSFSWTAPAPSFTGNFRLTARIYTASPGATASFYAEIVLEVQDPITGILTAYFYEPTAGSTVDTTGALTLDVTGNIDVNTGVNEWTIGNPHVPLTISYFDPA